MSNETKTHVIDGKTFVEVERKAKVGEKVIIVESNDFKVGTITECTKLCPDDYDEDGSIFVAELVSEYVGGYVDCSEEKYSVLEPVDQAPTSTADIIANLVRRVHSLERQVDSLSTQLRDTQRNVERQGVEIGEVQYLAKTAYDGITEHTAPKPCEDENKSVPTTDQPQVFDLAKIKSFKVSDLNGKTLRIHSATDTAEGISVTTTVAIDVNDGKMYVLESEVIR